MNLENMKHGFCAKHPNLSKMRAIFLESAWFGRHNYFSNLGFPRFTVAVFFPNVPAKWMCPTSKEIESSYSQIFHVMRNDL